MVELHGHPIAVHIPNGVLPVAVLFLLAGMVIGFGRPYPGFIF